ncbi:hypothetical protein F0562_002024 [Nyssa sinensis]|uniref:DUF1995 domain-containing protein n=1 Tax=Nyssa sinensis TaxID=561372 RepID=A0A5J5C8L7_9ASTE|nr:hypothetical protein F0562_002024 [Nyssa sinensis]
MEMVKDQIFSLHLHVHGSVRVHLKLADRVKPEDEMFLVGYPYFNVNEMLVVEELYREAVVNTARKLIIFNGELDHILSPLPNPHTHPPKSLTKTQCATLVPRRCLEMLEINMFACISKKLCHPSRKLPWIFFRPFDFQYVNHLVQMPNTMFSNSF